MVSLFTEVENVGLGGMMTLLVVGFGLGMETLFSSLFFVGLVGVCPFPWLSGVSTAG